MIERKKQLNADKGNIRAVDAVTQKTRLMDELQIAKQQGNFNKVSKILGDLKRLKVYWNMKLQLMCKVKNQLSVRLMKEIEN